MKSFIYLRFSAVTDRLYTEGVEKIKMKEMVVFQRFYNLKASGKT